MDGISDHNATYVDNDGSDADMDKFALGDVIDVVDMVCKVVNKELVISVKLTADVVVVAVVVKVMELMHVNGVKGVKVVHHQLLDGKL